MRGEKDERVNQIVSECDKLVQKENKTEYDCSGNLIKGINNGAVPLVRYSRPCLKRSTEEL